MAVCTTNRCAICSALTAAAFAIGLIFILCYVYWWPEDQKIGTSDMDIPHDPNQETMCDPSNQQIEYTTTSAYITINENLTAYVDQPLERSCKGAILLFHDFYGLNSAFIRTIAADLAKRGYRATVPDLFRGNPWMADEGSSGFDEWVSAHAQQRIDADVQETFSFVTNTLAIPTIGAVGFGWGGRQAVLASARLDIKAAVSFYATGIQVSDALAMRTPTLLLHADNDTVVPIADVLAFQSALQDSGRLLRNVADNSRSIHTSLVSFVKIFSGVGHGFVDNADQNDPAVRQAATEALADMYTWLERYLPTLN
ncbi:carboxymethylenebutenolidase homolog [Ptychodera flava]|uniref:carboxymethylenebutenolidase homolog n=1 Tax=Ptychodera flava TaxID=63121 RepID=UPI003969E1D4